MSQQITPKASFSLTAASAVVAGNSPSVIADNSPNADGNPRIVTSMDVMQETLKNYWVRAGAQLLLFFLFFLVGCLFYSSVEGWTVGTCIMFTIVTISTVGYGYHHPTTDESRIFTIFYIIVGIYFVFFTISNAITANFEAVKKYVEERAMSDSIGANINRHKYTFVCTVVSIFVCTFVAGGIFQNLEDWSFVEGIYFAVETSTVRHVINSYCTKSNIKILYLIFLRFL